MASSQNQSENHDAQILDQFTRQAEPFVRRHAHHNQALLNAMADSVGVTPHQTVLDVACGPGIVSCFFATRARHVIGLDIVPAMLERARLLQAEQHLDNVTWQLGPSTQLPFEPATFDLAVTRFSFHHFLEPEKALREMMRVTRPGGTVLVCDVAPAPIAQDEFNRWEVLRDPSHTRAFTEAELEALAVRAGLQNLRKQHYGLEMDLDGLLDGSFPNQGDRERILALFEQEVQAGTDHLGVAARRVASRVDITYPVLLLASNNPKA